MPYHNDDRADEPVLSSLDGALSSAEEALRSGLSRLSNLTDLLCGPVPAEAGTGKDQARQRSCVFDAVEHTAATVEGGAREIHSMCDRIEKRVRG